jgi:hypothetical protein
MYLLVIGLVAVIVAFLVAAFFSMRRGHDDEDEPARRPSVRDRIRGRGGDARDREARWDSGARQQPPGRRPGGRGPAMSRRPGRDARDPGPADRRDRAGYEQSRGYEPSSRGYGEPAPIRGHEGQRERTPSARRGARYDDATETVVQAAARPARSGQAAPTARPGGDSFGTGPAAALYDTGPSAAAPDDYPTGQVNADPALADSDVFPRVRADIPRPDSKTRQRSQPKTRSGRPSRSKHDDDDDWPSTEWDKLSDEQYWAELSADKPLATTARTAQSSSPAAAKPARGQAARPAATPRPDRDRAAAGADRSASRRSRDRAGQDDATQQLDTRQTGRSGARPPAARPRGAQAPDPGDRDTRAAGSHPASRAGRPAPGRDYDGTERTPARSRSRAAAEMPPSSIPASAIPASAASVSTGPIGAGPIGTGPMNSAPMNSAPADPARRRSAPRGPVGDDPLTSPAYARDAAPARDSRSYRGSGRAAQPDPARGAAGESRGYPRSPDRGDYPAGPAEQDSYRGPADGRRDYPAPASRHGYPAAAGERTDPNARYPATAPPARSSWDDDARPAETTSPQSGSGNPYGSFVDSAPPPAPDSTGPTYPPAAPPAPAANGQGSYGAGPAGSGYGGPAGYPDPYGPGRDGYPATAGHGSQDPGTTWYSAPPAAAAPPPPAAYPYPASPGGYQDSAAYQHGAGYPDSGPYPNGAAYQNGGGGYPDSNDYPGSNGYSAANGQHAQHAQPGQADYDSRYADDSQQNARYPGGPGTDPYGPDGYGGYHSRQG